MHVHTGYCGHGEGTVEQYVEAAAAAGINTMAFTEHYPLSHAFDPDIYLSIPQGKLDEYCETVTRIRDDYPRMEILLGCELDWLGDQEDRDAASFNLDRFEFILGSVHFVDAWAFDDPACRDRWEEIGPDTIWERYFDIWFDAVLSDVPYTAMAHPDLAKKFNYYPSFDLQPFYQRAAEAVRESGRMVEVNTSGAYYACNEMFPAPGLLREFCRAGVPCTIGTDAHHPDNIARSLDTGLKLMYDCGYREVTVPTRKKDRRAIPLI